MKKIVALVVALALCLTAVAAMADPIAKEDIKIGVILLHDEDSGYDLNFINAVNEAAAELGLSEDQIIIERNVDESNDCYEKAIGLADEGCAFVFSDSYGHSSYMREAALARPDCDFISGTGDTAALDGVANFHNAFAAIYQGRFLAGIAAGMKLNEMKANGQLKGEVPTIGYVSAFSYAEMISGYTGFYLGAKYVCPDVVMKVTQTGEWLHYDKEYNGAKALIAAGCDLISEHADSMGCPTACEEAGVVNVAYNGSTLDECPNTFLIASRIDWSAFFVYAVNQKMKGEALATDWAGDLESGCVKLTELNEAIAAEGTAAAIEEAKAKLIAGELHVFDTSAFTVNGEAVTTCTVNDQEVVSDGYFHESEVRSAPYFSLMIDGIEMLVD
ncbi:MAG: BMP family ABC transporter substrate-binding protein [Clostridia bacterium]|nr:BMP family ABC transporter substrate-binding protein [Clostridia bacterium]